MTKYVGSFFYQISKFKLYFPALGLCWANVVGHFLLAQFGIFFFNIGASQGEGHVDKPSLY